MLLNSEAQLLVSPALPASGQLVGGRGEGEGQVGGEQLGADLGERLNGLSPETRLITDTYYFRSILLLTYHYRPTLVTLDIVWLV